MAQHDVNRTRPDKAPMTSPTSGSAIRVAMTISMRYPFSSERIEWKLHGQFRAIIMPASAW